MTDPEAFLEDGANTYESKNDDYGDSWRLVGEIIRAAAGGEVQLKTREDFISFGLYTRRLDKLLRGINGEFNSAELNHESIKDSHTDEMVYAAMHASNQTERDDDKPPVPGLDHVTVKVDTEE